MTPRAAYARRRMRSALRYDGMQITLRRVTKTSGPNPAVNPPRVQSVVVSGNHPVGATVLNLTGAALVGAILLGDVVVFSDGYAVASAGQAVAASNAVAITLNQPLAIAVAGGTAVSFSWATDKVIYAKLTRFAQALVEGERTLPTDMRVRIAAMDVATQPQAGDIILLELNEGQGPRTYTVGPVFPVSEDNVVIAYDLQAHA